MDTGHTGHSKFEVSDPDRDAHAHTPGAGHLPARAYVGEVCPGVSLCPSEAGHGFFRTHLPDAVRPGVSPEVPS